MARFQHPDGVHLVLSLTPDLYRGLVALRDAEHVKGNAISWERIALNILRRGVPDPEKPVRPLATAIGAR